MATIALGKGFGLPGSTRVWNSAKPEYSSGKSVPNGGSNRKEIESQACERDEEGNMNTGKNHYWELEPYLFIGDCSATGKFDFLICCSLNKPSIEMAIGGLWVPFNDKLYDWNTNRDLIDKIRHMVMNGIKLKRQGRTVICTCNAGRNRSCLIAALILIQEGYPPEKAIELIRRRRGLEALSNHSFVQLIEKGKVL